MNKYYVQYVLDGEWVSLCVLSPSIYDAIDWAREAFGGGISVTNMVHVGLVE